MILQVEEVEPPAYDWQRESEKRPIVSEQLS